MIWLEDGRHELKQWDTGVFVLTNDACSWLEVSRDGMQEAQRVDVKRVGGNLRARIPDELMTQPGYLQIAAVNEDSDGAVVNARYRFRIASRPKPEGYVFGDESGDLMQKILMEMAALRDAQMKDNFALLGIGEDGWLYLDRSENIADELDFAIDEDGELEVMIIQ